jgi:hypothetical protein
MHLGTLHRSVFLGNSRRFKFSSEAEWTYLQRSKQAERYQRRQSCVAFPCQLVHSLSHSGVWHQSSQSLNQSPLSGRGLHRVRAGDDKIGRGHGGVGVLMPLPDMRLHHHSCDARALAQRSASVHTVNAT